MRGRCGVALTVIVAMLLEPVSWASHTDGIALSVTRGPGPGDVTLSWSGGQPSYVVHRSATPQSLLNLTNRVGALPGTTFIDSSSTAAPISYYEVASVSGTPIIDSITPSGGSFGSLITIYGSGFGTDRGAVQVRFTYTEGGETLEIDQPVFETTGTSLSLMVPLAVPNRVNEVRVLVGAGMSNPEDYFVGPLPPDPTPTEAGNEVDTLIDEVDLLMERVDGKLDAWFRQTDTIPQANVDTIQGALSQGRAGLLDLRAYIATEAASDPQILHTLDLIVSSEAYELLRSKLRSAAAALENSPLGQQMCEGRVESDDLDDVLQILDTLTEVIDIILAAIQVICFTLTIVNLFTGGALTPVAAILCGTAMSIVRRLLSVIGQTLELTANAMRAIPLIAPTVVFPQTYFGNTFNDLWGFDQPIVYVNGTFPVVARSFATFHNQRCFPNGCDIYVGTRTLRDAAGEPIGVEVTEIRDASECGPFGADCLADGLVPLHIDYKPVPDLRMDTRLTFERVGSLDAFHEVPPPFATPEGDRAFVGSDVHGPASDGWRRGDFYAKISAPPCGGVPLPEVTRTFTLVAGPRLNLITDVPPGVDPNTARLGHLVQLHGQYMPPHAFGSETKAQALFGDANAPMDSTIADQYTLRVPDTTNAAGTIGMRVDGRIADRTLPFDVLPPVLTGFSPTAPFPGEIVELQGTGLAADPNENAITFNGMGVTTLSRTPGGVTFRVPAGATGTEPVQVTAVGVHVSNTLGIPVAAWADSTRLSHPDRSALHPAMAVDANGVVGVAWMDTHTDGGATRLLFTDAAPGDASFRDPIEITEEVVGYWANPQEPDVAVGPNGLFHLVWVNDAGELTTVAFAKGDTPTGANQVTVASPDGVFRDPTIAVMPNGDVHIVAVDVPIDAAPHNIIVQFRSIDGGASWEPGVDLHGPGNAPPGQRDSFQAGDPELFAGPGGLMLAYTKGCFLDCDTLPGTTIVGRGAFTSGSVDGINWSAPRMVSPRSSINGGDLFHPMFPTVSNAVMQRRPVVVGDPNNAIAAWEAPTYGTHTSGKKYATLNVSANREPWDPNTVSILTPTMGDYQNDYGWPTLAYVPGGPAQTSIAWVERTPGTSPDRVEGVPRIKFNRSTDGLATLNIASHLTPTVDPGDTTTIDDEPSLAVDGTGRLHLVWLEGPEKNKVVRYTSTGTAYADTAATDPGEDLSFRNAIFIDLVDSSTESIGLQSFGGTIVYWPGRPLETRWINAGVDYNLHPNHDIPSAAPNFSMFGYGTHEFFGPTLTSLDGRPRLFASDNPAAGDVMSELIDPVHTGDIVVAGRPLPGNQVEIVVGDPNTNHFTSVTPPFTKGAGGLHIGVSPNDQYAVYQDVPAGDIVIVELSTGTEVQRTPGRNPVWWPVDDGSGVFWVGYVVRRTIPGPATEYAVAELATDGTYDEWLVTDPNGFVGRVAYSRDGGEIVWDCLRCGDAAADADGASTIWLGNAGVTAPRLPGKSNFSPEFSPDGGSLAFFQNDAPVLGDTSMELRIWEIGPDVVDTHLGPAVGDTPAGWPNNTPRLVWRPD